MRHFKAMKKQETNPAKLRELRLSQPRASAQEMESQTKAGIAWQRGSSKQTASAASLSKS
jgi:hypothetical protein